jgi:outer membrane lipoprotein
MRTVIARPLLRLLAAAPLLVLAACAPAPIYKATGTIATEPYRVAEAPERFGDAPVVWGGRVVEVRNLADHSEIEVLAYPLDGSQRPKAGDTGIGRFIATMPGYVESMDYPPGALMTVDGRISGSRAGKVGEAPYVFPLVKVNQSHVWTASELSSGKNNVHFGVGLGVGIR